MRRAEQAHSRARAAPRLGAQRRKPRDGCCPGRCCTGMSFGTSGFRAIGGPDHGDGRRDERDLLGVVNFSVIGVRADANASIAMTAVIGRSTGILPSRGEANVRRALQRSPPAMLPVAVLRAIEPLFRYLAKALPIFAPLAKALPIKLLRLALATALTIATLV